MMHDKSGGDDDAGNRHQTDCARTSLARAWREGFNAAMTYQRERAEDLRVFRRHGITGGPIPDPPDNPYLDRPDWEF